LRAFRAKFGRGWDLEGAEDADGVEGVDGYEEGDGGSLMDLISGASGSGKGGEGAGAMGLGERKKGKGLLTEKEVKMVTIKQDGVLIKVPMQKAADRRKTK